MSALITLRCDADCGAEYVPPARLGWPDRATVRRAAREDGWVSRAHPAIRGHRADYCPEHAATRSGGTAGDPGAAGDPPDTSRATSPEVANIIGDYARRANAAAPRDCSCPAGGGVIRHQRDTCTDPVARQLDWYAS